MAKLSRNYDRCWPSAPPSAAVNQDTYYWLLGIVLELTSDLSDGQSTFAQDRDFLLAAS